MNILFLTIGRMDSIEQHAIYPDLLRCFRNNGHKIYIVSTYEKRVGKETECIEENGVKLLHVKVGNLTKCNVIEKGISTIKIDRQFKLAIKKYYSDIKFDLVLYSTPPITLVNVIKYIKKRDGALSYLLLKDIFPQNAVDMGMLTTTALKGIIYRFFRNKEKKLYQLSDCIGCMSLANVDYVLNHNPEISKNKVEVCPNSVEVINRSVSKFEKDMVRKKYGIPLNKKVFIYGGNLGKPQGISFLLECLQSQSMKNDRYFLIVGDGTEYGKIESFIQNQKPCNVKLLKKLPKNDYDAMVGACDIGMIFLDHRFTIPNFPSRLLAYMQAKIPVLAVTDSNTDIGKVIVDGKFGWWCESNNLKEFQKIADNISQNNNLQPWGIRGYEYLVENYTVDRAYQIIIKKINGESNG